MRDLHARVPARPPGREHAEPVSTRELLTFLAFSHGWTWLFWMMAAIRGTSVWEAPGVYFLIAGGLGLPLGGIVATGSKAGAGGLREMAGRIVDPRRIPSGWWAVVLLAYPVLTLIGGALAGLAGVARPLDGAGAVARLTDPVGTMAMLGFLLLIGPLPEEIGWRGYLQDRLQTRWTALAASLAVGGLWWAWHLPLFLVPGYFDSFGSAPPGPLYLLLAIVPATVLYAWVYNNTNRSILAGILFHLMDNASGELLGLAAGAIPYRIGVDVAAAIAVVWWWGPRTLSRPRARR